MAQSRCKLKLLTNMIRGLLRKLRQTTKKTQVYILIMDWM